MVGSLPPPAGSLHIACQNDKRPESLGFSPIVISQQESALVLVHLLAGNYAGGLPACCSTRRFCYGAVVVGVCGATGFPKTCETVPLLLPIRRSGMVSTRPARA